MNKHESNKCLYSGDGNRIKIIIDERGQADNYIFERSPNEELI